MVEFFQMPGLLVSDEYVSDFMLKGLLTVTSVTTILLTSDYF